MSYILDALKKAEAERKLGSVPGLNAQPANVGPTEAAASRWKNPWLWATVTMVALLTAGAAWHFFGRTKPAAPVQAAQPAAATPAAPAAPPATVTAQPAPPAPVVAENAQPQPAAAAPDKAPAHPKPKKKAQPKPAAPVEAAARNDDIDTQNLTTQPPVGAPDVNIGGSIYSSNPKDRSVIINQRLLREGEQVSPDLKLEKILPNGVVMNYRGMRFRKGY